MAGEKLPRHRHDFIPPQRNETLRAALGVAFPTIMRVMFGIQRVEIAPADLERLVAMRDERVMLTPNHPSNAEPAIMYHLAGRAGMWINTLSAREVFDEMHGLLGKVAQQMGAYSIVRGTPDRSAFRMTREILAKPGAKLVVFPEGEVYTANDRLIPFRSGVVQLAFWAQEDMEKAGVPAPVYLLPVGVKYVYTQDMRPAILRSLERCEAQLGLTSHADDEPYPRLRRVAHTALTALEHFYGLKPGPEEDFTPRIAVLRESLMERAAATMGVRLNPADSLPDRIRALWNAMHAVTSGPPPESHPYRDRLRRERIERSRPLLRDLNRVHNAMALTDGYVRDDPSPERMMDTLRRLEFEVCGKAPEHSPRIARVRIGEPIDLSGLWPEYRQDKKGTVAAATHRLEYAVASLLAPTPPMPGQTQADSLEPSSLGLSAD